MKYYVLFKKNDCHKLGNIELDDKTIAVFDVNSRNEGQLISDELFGTNYECCNDFDLNTIQNYAKQHNLKIVDVNSEI